MPVILEPKDSTSGLCDPGEQRIERLRGLLESAAPGVLTMYPVSPYVNKATNEGEKCIEPAEGAA